MTDLGGEYKQKGEENKLIMTKYNSLNTAVKEMQE